jgi:hypothetical protein
MPTLNTRQHPSLIRSCSLGCAAAKTRAKRSSALGDTALAVISTISAPNCNTGRKSGHTTEPTARANAHVRRLLEGRGYLF